MMLLTLLPCGDFNSHEDLNDAFISLNSDNEHDHSRDADNCSPFCVCACCGVIYNFDFTTIQLPERAVQIDKKFPSYSSSLNSNDFIFIWKPPKIS